MNTIEDGSGSGYRAQVDSSNRLRVRSVSEAYDKVVNLEGNQWSAYFTATPTGAGDYFFYLKNSGINDLLISDIRIMCASTDTFTYEKVMGTPSGGVDITPINRNLGSAKQVSGTVQIGVDITGLTSQGVIFFERVAIANKREKLSTTSNIIIPQGSAFAIKAATGTAEVTCVVSLTEAVL